MAENEIQSLLDKYNSQSYTSDSSTEWDKGFSRSELRTGLASPYLDKTAQYVEEQAKADNEWKIPKAMYNGFVVQTAKGLQGLGQMIIDRRAEDLKSKGYDVPTDVTDHAMEVAKDSNWNAVLERYNVQGDTKLGQLGLDLAEGAGQLVAQAAVTFLSGGTAGGAFMGAQIAGNQYNELRQKGVDSDRAMQASLANAIVQGYMEKWGFEKAFKAIPANSPLRKKMVNILEGFFSEGITEGLQEFPEQVTNIWALNKDATLRQMAAKWDENAEQNIKDMLYSGFIGGVLGGAGASARVLQSSATEYAATKYHEHLVGKVEERINAHKASGMDAQTIADTVNHDLPNAYVEVPGDVLQSYMQQKNASEVAEALGTTVEEIEAAAEIGGDVTVRQGNYEATSVKFNDFAESTKDHISFGNGDNSINNVQLRKDLRKSYEDLSQKTRVELDDEVGKIIESARVAGVSEAQRNSLEPLLISRAMIANPENPAQFFKDHPLEFNNAREADNARGYYKQDGENFIDKQIASYEEQLLKVKDPKKKAQIEKQLESLKGLKEMSEFDDTLPETNNRQNVSITIDNSSIIGAHLAALDSKTEFTEEAKQPYIADQSGNINYGYAKIADESIPVRLQIGFQDVREKGFGYTHIYQEHRNDLIKKGYVDGNGNVDIIAAIKDVLGSQHFVVPNFRLDEKTQKPVALNDGKFIVIKNLPGGGCLTMLLAREVETSADGNVKEDFYNVEALFPRKTNFLKNAKKIALAFNGGHNSAFQLPEVGALKPSSEGNPAGLQAGPQPAGARKAISYGTIMVTDAKPFVKRNTTKFFYMGSLHQENSTETKGAISWDEEGKAIINLFKGADASTVIHETGHYFVEAFMQDSALEDADPKLKKDRAALLEYVGMTEEEWANADFEGKRVAHEKLAEGFETYLMEGKAPNRELRSVFKRFANWLKAVYEKIARNPNAAPLTPEVRQVFDRWLATEAEISAAERIDGYFAGLPKIMTDNLSEKYQNKMKDYIAGAHDKAVEILLKETMANFSAERRAKIKEYRKQIEAEASQEVAERQLYKAIAELQQLAEEGIIGTGKSSPKVIARKYLNATGKQYADWKAELDDVNVTLNDYLGEHIAELKKGVDVISKYWADRESGAEVDASDLKGKQETDESGSFMETIDTGDSAPWHVEWWQEHQRKITNADIKELAYQLAIGNDKYHVYGNDYKNAGADLDAEFTKAKAEIDRLMQRKEILEKIGADKKADYQGNISAAYADATMLLKKGVASSKIEKLTGWKHSDGKWSYDLTSEISVDVTKIPDVGKRSVKLSRVFDGGTIYQKLPFLKDARLKSAVDVASLEGATIKNDNFAYFAGSNTIYIKAGLKQLDVKKDVKIINELREQIAPCIEKIISENNVVVNSKKPMLSIGKTNIANVNVNAESWTPKMSAEDRISFELLAEQNGYTSGDHFATNIVNGDSFKQAVKKRIDYKVQERFPDIMAERQEAEKAAREALYNDESGKVVALEQQLIYDQLVKSENESLSEESRKALEKQRLEAAKQGAKNELRKMPLMQALKTASFVRAERRAAAMAAKAIKAGDMEGALTYKQQQLLNHEMVRESLRMRQYVKRARKTLRRQRGAKKETWGNQYHFNQAASLLERMGIGRKDYDATSKTQSLAEYVGEQQALGSNVDIAQWLLDESVDLSNPSQLSFSQYEDVIDALKNIKAIAIAERKQYKIEQETSFEQFKETVAAQFKDRKDVYTPEVGKKQKASPIKKLMASMRNTDNLFEKMDGWTYGYFSKTFGAPLKAAADRATEMTMAMEERLRNAYIEWLPTAEDVKQASESKYYDELGASMDKFTMVQMLANMGNESSLRVLCSTPPIGLEGSTLWVQPDDVNISEEQAIELTKTNLVEFLGRNLNANDMRYAQKLIDNANAYWDDLAQVNIITKGFAPRKVEAQGLTFQTADGETVFMKGGYFPLVRNREMGSHPAGQNSISDTDPSNGRNVQALHTFTGSSKARVNAKYPIDLSRGAELGVLNDTIHDICYREVMADFRKILNDAELFDLFKRKMGLEDMQQFREMLEKTANPYNNPGMAMAEQTIASTCSWLRRKTVNAAIMLNVKTSLQNLGNIFLYGRVVDGFGYADVTAAMGRWGLQGFDANGQTELNELCSKSVFMRERVLFPDISVREVVGESENNAIEKKALKFGAMMLAYTDNITAKPMWAQAYTKKILEGATETEAIDFADLVVRRTLGSSRTQDVSSLMRGGPLFKLFTTFQGFFNTQYNQWEREANIDWKLWGEGKRAEAGMRIAAFVASKYLFNCIAALILSLENPFEKDDDGYMKVTKEVMQYPLSMGGPIGQAGNMLINNLMGIRSYGYRMAAIQSTIDKGFKLGRGVNRVAEGKDDWTALIEPMVGIASTTVGIPDQLNKLFWNAYDIIFNDMSPEAGDLIRRRPKNERK